LFNCLRPLEPVLGARGSSRAALSQKVGAGAQATRGGPRATLSQDAGAGVTGTRGSPGAAPSWEVGAGATGTRDGPRAAPSREVGARALGHAGTRAHLVLCLDLELVRGGTWSSAYRQLFSLLSNGDVKIFSCSREYDFTYVELLNNDIFTSAQR
jgi:hypothetical protein